MSMPLPLVARVACFMGKSGRQVQLVLRRQPHGTELRCVYEGRLLWTELITIGPDHSRDVQRAVDDTRAAWEAKQWRCECAAAAALKEGIAG